MSDRIKYIYGSKIDQESGEMNHRTVGYHTSDSQLARMHVMAQVISQPDHMLNPLNCQSVLDVGCGWGLLRDYFKWASYVGIDIMPDFIREAERRHHKTGAAFQCVDFLDDSVVPGQFDLVVASGLFAWQESTDIGLLLFKMWNATGKVMAFNIDSGTMNLGGMHVILQSLGIKHFIARHDYLPNDTTFYCYRSELEDADAVEDENLDPDPV